MKTLVFPMRTRTDGEALAVACKSLGLWIGAEVGSDQGHRAARALELWAPLRLTTYEDWTRSSLAPMVSRIDPRRAEAETRARFVAYAGRARVVPVSATEALERVPDGTLDFVYLDERNVSPRLVDAWSRKLQPRGWLAGGGAARTGSAVATYLGGYQIGPADTWFGPIKGAA